MDSTKKMIESILMNANKGCGMKQLLDYMEENGFYTSPCSGAYHLSKEGGLAEHSLNVYSVMKSLVNALDDFTDKKISYEQIAIVALLHDLGKMGMYGKPNYVPNYVRSKTKNKETGEYDMVLSTAKPYVTNQELTYEEHEIRSLLIASKFIEITEEEATAILHHNGLYGKLDSSFGNANHCKTPLAYLLHVADMYCSRFVEVEQSEPE